MNQYLLICGLPLLCLTGLGLFGLLFIAGATRRAPIAPKSEKFRLGE